MFKNVVVHIPNLYANYLEAIVKLDSELPENYIITVFLPNELSDDEYRVMLKKNIKKNIRLAKRNNKLIVFLFNKFIGIFFRKYSKKYESMKWKFIDIFFKNENTEGLKRRIQEFSGNTKVKLGSRLYIERIVNINMQSESIRQIIPDLFIMIGGPYVKPQILNLFPRAINLHLGLLPFYRGSKTIEWCILKKDIKRLGATIHFMNSKIDAGRIIKRIFFDGEVKSGVGFVHAKLFMDAFQLLPKIVQESIEGCLLFSENEVASDSGYFFGYEMNSYHNYKLIKICEVK